MKVVILCGGIGMRLKEETEHLPKPMVKIGDKPILWHIMKIYAHYDFKDFILCLGYYESIEKTVKWYKSFYDGIAGEKLYTITNGEIEEYCF